MKSKYEPVALFDGLDYVLIGPVPVGTFSVGHDLPTDNAKTPDVAGRCEFTECDGFRGGPSDRNFTTLEKGKKLVYYRNV